MLMAPGGGGRGGREGGREGWRGEEEGVSVAEVHGGGDDAL